MTYDSSFKDAMEVCKTWNKQKNPPKVYTNSGTRIHHYQVGLVGLVLSLLLNEFGDKNDRKTASDVAGFSTGLVVDDFSDFIDDAIKFLKKHFSNGPYL